MKESRLLTADEILADTEGERMMIRFCRAVDAGDTPDDDTLEQIAACFRKVLDGEQLDKALGLARGRGRPPKTAHDAEDELGRVYDYVAEVLDRQAEGKTKEVALEETALARGIPEDTLRDWYKRQRIPAQVVRATIIRRTKGEGG